MIGNRRMKKRFIYLVSIIISFFAGKLIAEYNFGKKTVLLEERASRNAAVIRVFSLWMKNKQSEKSIATFLEKNNFHNIAIYGMHHLGEVLLKELQEKNITVSYAIDKNADTMKASIKMFRPDEELDEVDAIIVTPIFYFDEIERQLSQKVKCPIISLEDVIENM